jgi:hypothetical protein
MIKSVLQAIPSYVMGVYLLPESTIKDIERMLNSFWWGGGSNRKGIRWLAWDRMTYPKAVGGMGFRDLHGFNLAMIAKQGWNIMTKPHSLVAKLYKARYFPNSSLFASKLGHNPSYAWRGIWKAREILMHGCRWSIGNGSSIHIMEEPWLRDKEDAWLPSPQQQGVYNIKVYDLMHSNEKSWDKEKIESLFDSHVAKRILDIPLFGVIDDDKLSWVDNMYGEYSVRSGYNLWMIFLGKFQNSACHGDWNSLWKIHAPPKAKHLLWQICRGCLPTLTRLQERCVSCPPSCPICDHEIEDNMHVLFHCEFSAQSRISGGMDQFLALWLQQHQNLRDTILNICSSNDKNAAGLFATLIWVLWNNRNNCIWNNTKEQGRSLGYKAKHMWEEWHSVQHLQFRQHVPVPQQHVLRWQKPSDGLLKCNVDAAFHSKQNRTSVGWCLRDHQGVFVRAGTSWVEGICSVIEGESMALLTTLRELEEQGFSQVIIETDSQSLVNAIPHIHVGNYEFSAIVCQIKKYYVVKSKLYG